MSTAAGVSRSTGSGRMTESGTLTENHLHHSQTESRVCKRKDKFGRRSMRRRAQRLSCRGRRVGRPLIAHDILLKYLHFYLAWVKMSFINNTLRNLHIRDPLWTPS